MTKLIYVVIFLTIALIFCFSLVSKGLDKIESQRQEIAKLKTKVMWLEDKSEFLLAIEQLPPLVQDELKAMNELIKQGKRK